MAEPRSAPPGRLEHDPEKLQTFRKRSCDRKYLERKSRFNLTGFHSSAGPAEVAGGCAAECHKTS